MPFFKLAAFFAAAAVFTAVFAETGQATWYTQDGNPGACGVYNSDDSMIVALDKSIFSQAYCGSNVYVGYNGQTIYVTVADECEGCGGAENIDLSVAAFSQLSNGDLDEGVLSPVYWDFD